MEKFFKEALDFAVEKAKSEQQVKEIQNNFKDIFKAVEKIKKKDVRKTKTLPKHIISSYN